MKSLLCVAAVVCVVALAEAWPSLYDPEFKRWSLSRRSYCKKSGEKCYSSNDCCKSYVCAAVDEYASGPVNSLNPTQPGNCVHEKELELCFSNNDCFEGQCVSLGEHRYCVPRPKQEVAKPSAGKGNFGDACEDDSECKPFGVIGGKKVSLCCQWVKMGRQGQKKKCDRDTGFSRFSRCISPRK